jgi:hypothetical protein
MTKSLFAHLALTFGSHPENLATEALGYILRNSPGARAGVRDLFREAGCSVPDELSWFNQHGGEDNLRPDLVGIDPDGRPLVLVEAKFWAGLTDKQPVGYLDRLPPGGSLVIVGPARRQTLLWSELRTRIVDAGRPFVERPISAHGANVSVIGDKVLVLLSWRSLLAAARIRAEGEVFATADIGQLDGLCDRMDSEAFIPVTSDELTDHRFRRILEFCDIVDSVTCRLVESGIASTKGFRATSGKGFYARYMRLNGVVGASLVCDVHQWMKFGSTPVWLTAWKPARECAQLLAPLAVERPRRMFTSGAGFATVPMFVPVGKERHVLEQRMVEQVVDVAKLLAGLPAPSAMEADEPPMADLEPTESREGMLLGNAAVDGFEVRSTIEADSPTRAPQSSPA